jgi:hypothetical protein
VGRISGGRTAGHEVRESGERPSSADVSESMIFAFFNEKKDILPSLKTGKRSKVLLKYY